MGSEFLDVFIENAEGYASRLIPELQDRRLDRKGITALCFALRQHGVCTLLLNNNPADLYVRAMQSAGAYLFYLDYATDNQKVTSANNSFLDAVGSGYWDAAEAIARASRRSWNRDYEYEEDFLFAEFLMQHFFLNAEPKQSRAILEQHEAVTEGEDRLHRDICTAFLEKDSELFHQALTEQLTERREKAEAMVKRDAIPEEHWSWLRYFSLEGWALLKLAERRGLKTKANYLHVPKALRKASSLKFDPNAWRSFNYPP